jgi:RND family efflux transporter MFP subunit
MPPAESPDSTLWSRLSDASNEAEFCSAWLSLQCSRISGVTFGLLLVRQPDKELPPVLVTWPQPGLDLGALSLLAERAYAERRALVSQGRVGPDASPAVPLGLLIASQLGHGSQPVGAVAVALATTRAPASIAAQSVIEQLQWGAGWLEALPWARRCNAVSSNIGRAASCLDLLAAAGEQPRLLGMAMTVANDLTARLRCDRASVGILRRNGTMRVRAISHSATFKDQGRLIDAIENAMEEALDQRSSIAFPSPPSAKRSVTIAHRALADIVRVPGAALLSVLLANSKGNVVGAITVERHRNEPFDQETLQLAEALAALLGPMVALQLRANRLIAGRIFDRFGDGLTALLGPRRPALKLGAISLVALALVLGFARGEHRVTAKSVLEGEVQRAAVAPFEGFIQTAPVRAGDTVNKGDLLATLDDRDLILDQLKWSAERDKLLQRRRDALAKHDRTNLVLLASQIRQAQSQLELAEEKLARTRIVAPFDGVVVSGDLSQMLGSPVEKGKTLFEIAPLHAYRLIVQVDERDVRYVAVGQGGTLLLAGMPTDPLPLVVKKITPVTVAEEGRNSFRIEARLTELDPRLRPGMEGVAKIETGRRSIIWIWTHAVLEWLRLAAWKYLP